MSRGRLDFIAVAAAALAIVMAAVYVHTMRRQSDQPEAWFLGGLMLGAALAAFGARIDSWHRRTALLLAGIVLVAYGVLAILSIGFPIFVAGALCAVAAIRRVDVGIS